MRPTQLDAEPLSARVESEATARPSPMSWPWTTAWVAAWALAACGTAAIEAVVPDALTWADGRVGHTENDASPPARPQRTAFNPLYDPNRWISGNSNAFKHRAHDLLPFGSRDGTECAVTCSAASTACALMDMEAPLRQDLTDQQDCLPMRLMLRVVGTDCLPVTDALVAIWHPSPSGAYSGPTGRPRRCAPREPHAARTLTFRGQQCTDALGAVTFDTCFPGASPGRTTLVNLEISRASRTFLSTQLLFDDAMVADIEATQSLYAARVAAIPPTRNTADPNILPAFVVPMTLDVIQMPDGTMLAFKTLVLRDDPDEPLCSYARRRLVAAPPHPVDNSNSTH